MDKRYIMTGGKSIPNINGVLAMVVAAIALSSGCGGGSGATGGVMITRANRAGFTNDAMILAARLASGPWIPANEAERFDIELAAIRTQYPALVDIHAFPDYERHDLLVAVSASAPWVANWRAGNPTTGEPGVDNLLHEFDVDRVAQSLFQSGGREWFLVEFAQPLNMQKLAERFQGLSANIPSVDVNGYGGDGDRITYQRNGGGGVYSFSRGWGDCPTGCINRHFWTVNVGASGGLSVSESGDPLP